MRRIVFVSFLALSACTVSPTTNSGSGSNSGSKPKPDAVTQSQTQASASAVRQFERVVQRVEPVAEAECRARLKSPCDFKITIDTRAGQPANAYQTLDKQGRPIIAFTTAMIASAKNDDEIAFVLGHEASHHIERHIPKTRNTSIVASLAMAGLAIAAGASQSGVRLAQDLGGTVGARSFSRKYELEADRLGTVIAKKAGYNPVRGAAFFSRIPDPGDRFLGSHPPNAERLDAVRDTAAKL